MFDVHKTELGPSALRIFAVTVGIGLFVSFVAGGWVGWCAWMGFLAVLVVRELIHDRERTKLICAFASRMGFTFLGDSLPRSFPIHRTSSGTARSIRRVFAGDRKKKEIVVFDCRLGDGKGSFSRTMVAARGDPSVFGWSRFGPDLETEQVDEWTLVYGSKRLLLLKEIEALVSDALA